MCLFKLRAYPIAHNQFKIYFRTTNEEKILCHINSNFISIPRIVYYR